MPHVVVKALARKIRAPKTRLAEAIVKDVTEVLGYGQSPVSVAFEEISSREGPRRFTSPISSPTPTSFTRSQGYDMSSLP